jgi:hypothetical protein
MPASIRVRMNASYLRLVLAVEDCVAPNPDRSAASIHLRARVQIGFLTDDRRSASAAVIGHMKTDGHLGRC